MIKEFTLAWCIIYCRLNILNNKANTCEAGDDGEETLKLAIHVLEIN